MRSEDEVLGFWARNKIFEKSVKQRAHRERFVFYEGPPYANGLPGIHHVEARAYKDIIARYKTMRGFLVERRAGWDTHGLPTEMAAEKKLGVERKRDIEEKIGIEKFVEAAREDVFFYKSEWERMTERMGYWLDLKNPYVTMTNDYIESLWWIIGEFWRKKLLYEDYKVLPWCTRCGTALSSHELAQGYKEVTEDSIYVRFHLKTRRAALLIWTTTPWTLPANVATAVHPDLRYVTIEEKGEKFILLESLAKKLFPDLKALWEEKGEKLVGLEYEPLYPSPGVPYKVVPAEFVSEKEGTGIVHIAPAFGEDDMKVGKRENLPTLSTVDDEGRFTEAVPLWKGIFVKDADPLIIKDLDQKGFLYRKESFTHDYPFCWRCESPLIYFARRSWWVKTSAVRKELVEENKKINWYPPYIKEGRFGQWLAEVKDWAFSRERYWGTPLPLWRCEACEDIAVVTSIKELKELAARPKNTYILMRHGYAQKNKLDVAHSLPQNDSNGLLPRGAREVKAAAKRLAKEKIDLIISSDLQRARETTKILANTLKVPVLYDGDLEDIHFGEFEGQQVRKLEEWKKGRNRFKEPYPGGESWDDLKARMRNLYRKLERLHKGKKILVVGHADPLWFLESIMKGELEEGKIPRSKYLSFGVFHKVHPVNLPRNKRGELDLHRPYIDEIEVVCRKCAVPMRRVKDVVDVWFDSGAMPFAKSHFPFDLVRLRSPQVAKNLKLKVKSPKFLNQIYNTLDFPADYIAEAIDQTRGWFYVLLAVAVLLGRGAPYKNVLSLGHVLDKTGKKMSKSRGNVIEPEALFQKYGADGVRWYFFTINQPEDVKLFDEADVGGAKRNFLDLLLNSLRFYEIYKEARPEKGKKTHILERWIFAKLAAVRQELTRKLDSYDIVGSARILENFVAEDISRWYVRRSRERMRKGEGVIELREVLLETVKMAAPFIPFSSEIVYQALEGGRESIHLEDWPQKAKSEKRPARNASHSDADGEAKSKGPRAKSRKRKAKSEKQKILEAMEEVRSIARVGLELRARVGIKIRQPLASLTLRKTKILEREYFEILKEELNVKEIIVDKSAGEEIALDTNITQQLRDEGIARELVRFLQEMRKKAGLHPNDQILVSIEGPGIEALETKIKTAARIKKMLSALDLKPALSEETFEISGSKYVIKLKRAK